MKYILIFSAKKQTFHKINLCNLYNGMQIFGVLILKRVETKPYL